MARSRPNVYLHPRAEEALVRLQDELPREGMPRQARRQDIVSAIILYTSRQQAAGMLSAFLRTHEADRQDAAEALRNHADLPADDVE